MDAVSHSINNITVSHVLLQVTNMTVIVFNYKPSVAMEPLTSLFALKCYIGYMFMNNTEI